jgi:uroporphyrinogen decarboxylase
MELTMPDFQPDPDFRRLEVVLRRQGEPDRVPFYELLSNVEPEVLRLSGAVDEQQYERLPRTRTWDMPIEYHTQYMLSLGYDYILLRPRRFVFLQPERVAGSTREGERTYLQGSSHMIADRRDFEQYPWPDPAAAEYGILEQESILPGRMKVIVGYTGILENVMWLLGYEGISYMLYEDEDLVADMFDAVGSRIVDYMRRCASYESVGALQMGEDMGFKTQTLLSPEVYRKHLFPWHRRLVEAVHSEGKPIILHSCGNLAAVMEDVIDCGWDAKHSFEDGITPVWEAKERWGDRIALLGGFDVHRIATSSPEEVREHTRFLISRCAPGGGWALGTGNSVASYIPLANFFAMLEEGWRAGRTAA